MTYEYINFLTQFGRTDCELVVYDDDGNILLREGRQFSPKDDKKVLAAEAQRTIDILNNPLPVEPDPIDPAITQAKIDTINDVIKTLIDQKVDQKIIDQISAKITAIQADVEVADATPLDAKPLTP